MYQDEHCGDGNFRENNLSNNDAKNSESNQNPDTPPEASTEIVEIPKHPLQNRWTLWYLENDHTKAWPEMLNEIFTFDTVEDFWNVYNHFKPPSQLNAGCDYSLFKQGIRPMWEDASNKNGGRWIFSINKPFSEDLDALWLNVLLILIGETFVHSSEICGAVVNVRSRNNKIAIWTANCFNADAIFEIGFKLRECLNLGRQSLQYQLHRDTMLKQGSNVKAIYTL